MEQNSFDIQAMSLKTNLSIPTLKTFLGIPFLGTCNASTASEAKEMYLRYCTEGKEESDEAYLALCKWIELESSYEELLDAYLYCSQDTDAEENATAKLIEKAKDKIETFSFIEMDEFLDSAPAFLNSIILSRMYEVAVSFAEFDKIYESENEGPEFSKKVLMKLVELADTDEEFTKLLNYVDVEKEELKNLCKKLASSFGWQG